MANKQKYQDGAGKVTGRVRWFADDKGYGFIEAVPPVMYAGKDEEGTLLNDVYVHYKGVVMRGHKFLLPGQKVEFVIEDSSITGRPHAVGVTVIEDVPSITVTEEFLEKLKAENKRLKEEIATMGGYREVARG